MKPENDRLPVAASSLPVAVEAMGGDFGCQVAVEGAVQAARELGISSVLVGDQVQISKSLKQLKADQEPRLTICHAPEVISMEDSPGVALRRKPNSSIRVAFELVRERKASSVVSAGNTGAVMAAGLMVVGAFPGVVRPAIATLIPKMGDFKPTVLLDSGANTDCHMHQLVQFALMGSYYANSVLALDRPRVALLSNGTETSKGTDILRAASVALAEIKGLNFVGYVEGKHIPHDCADVIVCDGFVGNVVLKTMEGTVELVFDTLKQYVERSSRGKLGMWLAKPVIKAVFNEKLDPSSYGGAPLLGLNEVGIVCHGAASSRAILNGIRVAQKFSQEGLMAKIGSALAAWESANSGNYENGMWGRFGERLDKKKKSKAENSGTKSAQPPAEID